MCEIEIESEQSLAILKSMGRVIKSRIWAKFGYSRMRYSTQTLNQHIMQRAGRSGGLVVTLECYY